MGTGILNGNVAGMFVVSVAFDMADVLTITTSEQDVTVPGVKIGDMAFVNKPSLTAGLGIAGCRVKAADTISITYVNPTAGTLNAASENYTFLVIRPEHQTAASIISD